MVVKLQRPICAQTPARGSIKGQVWIASSPFVTAYHKPAMKCRTMLELRMRWDSGATSIVINALFLRMLSPSAGRRTLSTPRER